MTASEAEIRNASMSAKVDEDAAEKPKRMPAKRLRQTLYWLALDWIHLHDGMPTPPKGDGGRASNIKDYGHPAEWASVKAAEIADLMTQWHDFMSEHRDETRPRRKLMRTRHDEGTDYDVWVYAVNEQQRMVAAWRYLEPRCEDLVALVDAEALKELPDLHFGIRRALGAMVPKYTLPVPCPNQECELLTLVRVQGVGQDFISCDACGYTIKEAYYPLLIRIALDAFISGATEG